MDDAQASFSRNETPGSTAVAGDAPAAQLGATPAVEDAAAATSSPAPSQAHREQPETVVRGEDLPQPWVAKREVLTDIATGPQLPSVEVQRQEQLEDAGVAADAAAGSQAHAPGDRAETRDQADAAVQAREELGDEARTRDGFLYGEDLDDAATATDEVEACQPDRHPADVLVADVGEAVYVSETAQLVAPLVEAQLVASVGEAQLVASTSELVAAISESTMLSLEAVLVGEWR